MKRTSRYQIYFLVGISLLWPTLGHAQAQFRGLSSYSILNPSFPCDAWLDVENAAAMPGTAIVWGTFGNSWECAIRFSGMFATRPHLVEIHFSNEVCRRNHFCFAGELFQGTDVPSYNKVLENLTAPENAGYLRDIQVRAAEISQFAQAVAVPNTTFVLSTGLEDNYTQAAYESLLARLREIWPYAIVRNPGGGNRERAKGDAELTEWHIRPGRDESNEGCIANEDGQDRNDMRWLKPARHCVAAFFWRGDIQGLNGRRRLPPLQRRFSLSPSEAKRIKTELTQ